MNIIINLGQGARYLLPFSCCYKMWIKVLLSSCVLLVLLVQLGDGKEPTNRPSNGK